MFLSVSLLLNAWFFLCPPRRVAYCQDAWLTEVCMETSDPSVKILDVRYTPNLAIEKADTDA